jgi:heterodisulfide reductase subunit A
MTDVGRHPNIKILAYTDVREVEGEAGDFRVTLTLKPRYVKEDLCTGCGTCSFYCPYTLPNPFDENLSSMKAINKLFPQAVPPVSTIDKNAAGL